MAFDKRYLIFLAILAVFSMNLVFAQGNDTAISDDSPVEISTNESLQVEKVDTKIESRDVTTYYKEKSELVSYLKDSSNQPISNKKVSISINDRTYDKVSDGEGKVTLKLNLKPGTYAAKFRFDGDDKYSQSQSNAVVKVKRASLGIITKDYKTHWHSDLFFKAKVINKVTKNPVKGVKVGFKVYTKNKYRIYYATTDDKGIARLNKNIKVGSHKVITFIKKSKNVKSKKSKATLTVRPTEEWGCSSVYLQISSSEAVCGFRRDSTDSAAIRIVKTTFKGKNLLKQYKNNDEYFCHMIISANGWMVGTGGGDVPKHSRAIEKMGCKMIKSGKIKKSYLKKIRKIKKKYNLGHFVIKAPNGKYAIVWPTAIKTGKLKAGKYLCVPNKQSYFKHGKWSKFGKNPAKSALKILGKDSYGDYRRDAISYHWKATTKDGVTNSSVKAYATNDDGHYVGKKTWKFRDNVYFKGKFFSKTRLPKVPSKLLIGIHEFGTIAKSLTSATVQLSTNRAVNESYGS